MPILDRPVIVAVGVVYVVAILAVGLWSARRTRSPKDFWIAGQRIGLWITALATMSAAFSGFVFLGGPGLMYTMGLGSMFINASVGLTAGLLCWTVGKRLRLLAEVREVFTVPDAILHRFDSRLASGVAALSVLVGTIAYLGLQFLALGCLVEAVFGISTRYGEYGLALAMGVAVVVLVLYSVAGGMIAGVYTDLVQGALMTLVAVAVFVQAVRVGGGFESMASSIAGSVDFGSSFLEPLGRIPLLTAVSFYFVFSVGVLGQPHMLHKFYMIDDPRKLKWMPLVVGGSQTLCVLVWLGIGLVVPALVAEGRMAPLAQPDHATPLFLLGHSPDLLAGLALSGVLAAIMSSADSFINIAAAALVRDLPRSIGRPLRNELAWGRVAVVVVAVAAFATAYAHGDLIVLLGTFAFGTFGAALAPVFAVGLNWRRVTATAATASMSAGLVLTVSLELVTRAGLQIVAPGVLPAAVSMATSFAVLLILTWWSPAPENGALDDDLAAVMDA